MTALLLLAAVSGPALAQPQPADLTYLGAFAIPDLWGQRGLSYDPTGASGAGSLWVTGHDFNSDVLEISIPNPVLGATNLGQLATATVLTNWRQMTSNCQLSADAFLASVEVLDGRVHAGCSYWYNTGGQDKQTMHSRLENWTDYRGPDHVGPPAGTYVANRPEDWAFHSSKIGGYLFALPQDWADQHTNGWRMVAGFQREAGAFGGSQGPPMIAFNPANPAQATDLVQYRENPDGNSTSTWCAGPNVTEAGQCDFPNYRACDAWTGADWVRSSVGDAILVVGAKYTGANNYSGGYFCGQGTPQILFYNPDDIVDRLAGNREPWEIHPYTVMNISSELWKTQDPLYTGTWTGGLAFDEAGGRLFLTEKSLPNGGANDGDSIVHVWSVDGSPPPFADLTITKAGSGTGTVTSAPTGINCGADCQETYDGGTLVTLTATPDTGFEFVGWSGHSDCADGAVTMNGNRSCTATFNEPPPPFATLAVTKSGSGTGTVTSLPGGIDCGTDCQEIYGNGTVVALTATPGSGFIFISWGGDTDCTDGSVTMTADRNCTATFADTPPPPTGGLVAAYGFDEGSGGFVADQSGNSNLGAISGASWNTNGYFGGALSFDGSNDMVDVPDANSLDLTTGMTIEGWVRPSSVSQWRTLIMKQISGNLAYGVWASDGNYDASAVWVNTSGSSGSNSQGSGLLPTNTWSHLAGTYDGSTLRMYVNGVQVGSSSASGALMQSNLPLTIGGNPVWGEYFDGLIDEVRVYNRALTAAEIQADMNAPVSCFGPSEVTLTGVVISGAETHEACDTLIVGPSVTISGQVIFKAGGTVRFVEPVTVEDGASMEVRIGPLSP